VRSRRLTATPCTRIIHLRARFGDIGVTQSAFRRGIDEWTMLAEKLRLDPIQSTVLDVISTKVLLCSTTNTGQLLREIRWN